MYSDEEDDDDDDDDDDDVVLVPNRWLTKGTNEAISFWWWLPMDRTDTVGTNASTLKNKVSPVWVAASTRKVDIVSDGNFMVVVAG
jgi:hypothetical protein